MKKTLVALAAILLAGPALAIEPVPGSITYGGRSHAKLQKSPVGSTLVHRFDSGSYEYEEALCRPARPQPQTLFPVSAEPAGDRAQLATTFMVQLVTAG